MRRTILPTVAMVLLPAMPSGASEIEARRDRFQLWNNCKPLYLLVERLNDDAKSIGLSKSRIETIVRSRLRAARAYTDNKSASYVYVNVNVVGQAFSVRIVLNKWVEDEASGEGGVAATWNTGGTGTHGKDGGYVLSGIGEHTDKFIDEYLRVNEKACKK